MRYGLLFFIVVLIFYSDFIKNRKTNHIIMIGFSILASLYLLLINLEVMTSCVVYQFHFG